MSGDDRMDYLKDVEKDFNIILISKHYQIAVFLVILECNVFMQMGLSTGQKPKQEILTKEFLEKEFGAEH